MARDPEAINAALSELIQPEARGRLLALGMARGMVWTNGVVPEGVPERLSSATLTPDLLDFGYGILALALELRDANRDRAADAQFQTTEALRVAAEAIESAVRRGLFIHDQLDELVDVLCDLQAAVAAEDGDSVAGAAAELAQLVMPERFFSVRKLPEHWEDVLADWVKGTPFSEILEGRKSPAFALSYGVPTIPAALLCQMGFSSRVGALWVK